MFGGYVVIDVFDFDFVFEWVVWVFCVMVGLVEVWLVLLVLL